MAKLELSTWKPNKLQGESTKNCPYCGSESAPRYVEDVPIMFIHKNELLDAERWYCGNCGGFWHRPIDEDELKWNPIRK